MGAAEEYGVACAQLRRTVAQGGKRISLAEFTTLPQLREIIDELHAAQPDRTVIEARYVPALTTAPGLIEEIKSALAGKPSDPLPLVVIYPGELRAAPEDERAAFDFWQAMNFRRELLGQLPAQILLGVDPWNKRWLIDRAADLWSWLMPKIDLRLAPEHPPPRGESLPALSSFADYRISPEIAESQWQTLWPLLESKSVARQIEPGDFRRLIFPLMESSLAAGNLERARKVRDAVGETAIPDEDRIVWHKQNGFLACGAADFLQAEDHASKLLDLARTHSRQNIRVMADAAATELANLLGDFGQQTAAEYLDRQLVEIDLALFGPEHPRTLASRNNLAAALRAQGRTAEAEAEHRAVLAIRERVLGPEHPDVFTSCYNLAVTLRNQGKLAEAREYALRAEVGWSAVLGAEHPDARDARILREKIESLLAS